MVCVELAMHLNPLPGEGSEAADQAPVLLSILSLPVGRMEGLILEWRVLESLRGVAPVWTLGASPFIPLNPCFFPLDPLCLSFVSPASLAHSMFGGMCWAFSSGSLLHWHIWESGQRRTSLVRVGRKTGNTISEAPTSSRPGVCR